MNRTRTKSPLAVMLLAVAAFAVATPAAAEVDNEVPDPRIERHLTDVEDFLRARDVSHLSPELREARLETLEDLANYRQRGLFPRNLDYPEARVPYFIDDRGVACAVAHLMIVDGFEDEARAVANRENNAWVMEMTSPEIEPWLVQSGLTLEEAAWIQPTYGFCDDISNSANVEGPTQAQYGETITLVADEVSGADCPPNYYWEVVSGEPAPTLAGESTRELQVTFPEDLTEQTEYSFRLMVQNQGFSDEFVHRVAVSADGTWQLEEPEPEPEPTEPIDEDRACSTTMSGNAGSGLALLFAFAILGLARRRRR